MRLLDSARIGLAAVVPDSLRHPIDHLRPGKIMPSGIPRKTLAVSIALSAALVTSSPAHAAINYSPPPKLPTLSASTLTQRYDLNRAAMAKAADEAQFGGDPALANSLRNLAIPSRDFLSFDPSGNGRGIEVVGDLVHAKRIAVVVPGAGNTLSNFDGVKGTGVGAEALYDQAQKLGAHGSLAVIGWLGYDAPSMDSIHVTTLGHAAAGAKALKAFLSQIKAVNNAPVSLLCHSYGSVVCGQAAPHVKVTDIAVFGSPGMGVGSVSDLDTSAQVWAGRSANDGIADVPHVQVDLLGVSVGFGDDPVDPAFGARLFNAGTGGHSDYLRTGNTALYNLALIALGRDSQVGPPQSGS
ncbi:alpha/beta hydrolase [Catenulispora pinisilvae]|uniref:alpha/beta hydrolase n=1 Tax=Catenulispora pinisilvae TaxID=2705253 RepID=UPI001890D7E6|nr:alpha/beta hydrolase [Catenulispora pinisilvae]